MRAYIAGYGSIGRRHHRILKELVPGIAVDIYDPFLGHNALPHGRYDIGLVCTSTSSHLTVASGLVDSCDLLFIEKPLHTSISEIKRLRSTFGDKKVHVGCNVRYTAAVRRLASIRNEARLVRVTAMSNLLKWRDDPEKKAYSFHASMGGGVLMDFIHEPDYIFSVFGLPEQSHVYQSRLHRGVTVDSDDSCVMNWMYRDSFVTFTLSYCSTEYVRRIDVLKEDGSSEVIDVLKDDIEASYKKQWEDILENGPKNSYVDCLELYSRILEA